MGNEAVLLPFQTPLGGSKYDLSNALHDLGPLLSMRPRNLHLEEVYITPFPLEYHLPDICDILGPYLPLVKT